MYRKAEPVKYLSSKKVLIIESDRLTRSFLSKIISNYLNCDVNIACCRKEAESFLKSVSYDLFVIGVSGDISDDLSLIKKLQTINKNIPVVVVTGDCHEDDLELIKSAGIGRIVYKPLKLTPFLETVAGAFIESERVFNYA